MKKKVCTIKAQTAVLIIKEPDGSFKAMNDLTVELELDYTATRQDIKTACQEVLDAINRDAVSETVLAKLSSLSMNSTDKALASVRQALSDKGIL